MDLDQSLNLIVIKPEWIVFVFFYFNDIKYIFVVTWDYRKTVS